MASNEPNGPRSDRIREPVEDALARLEERLDRASQAAERLLADAAGRMTATRGEAGESATSAEAAESPEAAGSETTGERTGKPPPAGWQQPGDDRDSGVPLLADADLLLALFSALRDRIPPDLQQRLAEAIREVLLALRALIDWYLERSERARSAPTEVQDIPIL
jgi:hypothetical protein